MPPSEPSLPRRFASLARVVRSVRAAGAPRTPHEGAVAAVLFVLLVGAYASVRSGAESLLLVVDRAVVVAVLLYGTAYLVEVVSWGRVTAVRTLPAVASLVLLDQLLDLQHVATFGRHLDVVTVRGFVDAARHGAIPFAWSDVALLLCEGGITYGACYGIFVLLVRVSHGTAPRLGKRALGRVALFGVLVHVARVGHVAASALPWRPTAVTDHPGDENEKGLVTDAAVRILESDVLRRLDTGRKQLETFRCDGLVRPNIVIVHVESLRYDMLAESTAPSLSSLSKDSLGTRVHWTTGANTGSGIFGLLNGLHQFYYPVYRDAGRRSIPLELLKHCGYTLRLYDSNDTHYESIWENQFAGLFEPEQTFLRTNMSDGDRDLMRAFLARPPEAAGGPTFDYLLLNSTHYGYSYPPEFEKFTPVAPPNLGLWSGISGDIRKQAVGIKNRYRNSSVYVDSLIGMLVEHLRAAHRLDDTILVITGDHGEEFWEKGHFGHTFGLVDEQIHVPLLMHLPSKRKTRYEYSSHADVFPTILDEMGILSSLPPIMTGKSLLSYDARSDFAVAGVGVFGREVPDRYVVGARGHKLLVQSTGTKLIARDLYTDADALLADGPDALKHELFLQLLSAKLPR